ncbi:MAG TPA: hypothetical protein VFQ80_10665 [Thermomicrobiales bacterium]|jgi:hypothetical protein|nr:hypothetical protein [Thermomicrobiales bacterium]
MDSSAELIEQAPLQDRDLLQRLSAYFDGVEHRLRQGQGWFIFNARGGRSTRIASFMQYRLTQQTPPVSYFMLPWRDFALSAYVREVGLPELAPNVAQDEKAKREFELAARVTYSTWTRMLSTDLLILIGLQPSHPHEASLLDRTIETRHAGRLATILVTPTLPQQLEAEFQSVDPSLRHWERIFQRMYESSLVAL